MHWYRQFLCVLICAGALALLPARITAASPTLQLPPASALVADSWSWNEFSKFWKRQFGKTSGVVGMVLLVGAGAMVLIISRARR